MTCLDCKTSSRGLCVSHAATDNHTDAADLEIARLKAELEAVKLERDCVQGENEEWRKASNDWAGLHDVEKREVELSRLTEENKRLREAIGAGVYTLTFSGEENGVCDTIWNTETETLVDCFKAALGNSE